MGLLKSLTRIGSYVGKEIIQIFRRPGAFFSLVLGPFLIMALFGAGYGGFRRPLETVLVIPEGLNISRDAQDYQKIAEPALHIREVSSDGEAARAELARQNVDLVIIAPGDAVERLRANQQAHIVIQYNQIDPVLRSYVDFIASRLTQEVNKEIIRRGVAEGQSYAVAQGQQQLQQLDPEVIAAPTTAQTQNLAQTSPSVVTFFAPAVLALILQHMAVTLSALSLVRERLSGAMELFRISPVNSLEILLGKYLGFGIISAVIAALVTALLVVVLGVPLLSGVAPFALVVALMVLASLGLGLLISVVSDSERQAVQLSLLVLLASVFFSGFVLPVEEFHEPVRAFAYALPVTHGIRLMQDLMLRGGTNAGWMLAVLAAVSAALFLITLLLLRRTLARG